jgi:transposase-like protein
VATVRGTIVGPVAGAERPVEARVHVLASTGQFRAPPDAVLMAVRWYLAHSLSATSVMVLLAERGIDLSKRTVLRWAQTFGPLLATELRRHRRRPGTTWYVDEVFFFRRKGEEKRYLYRAIDEHGQVLDVLFREHRDTASAAAFLRRTLGSAGTAPATVVSDHHRPYIVAVLHAVGARLTRAA